MGAQNRSRSPVVLLLTSVVLPPAGIVLLWMRAGTGVFRKILGSLLVCAWMVTALVLFFGLRVELDGSGSRPFVNFYQPSRHYSRLERSRQLQKLQPVAEMISDAHAAPATDLAHAKAEPPASVHAARKETVASARNVPANAPGAYWSDFLGPRRDGHYDEMPILTTWPAGGLKRLWRQPVGGGYASFVAADGRAFTIEQRRRQEVVTAYDVVNGRELWAHGWDAAFHETLGGDGPRACPSWHDGRVYALGAAGELRCLEADTGKRIWSRNILTDNGARNLPWGMAAAPLVVDGKVIVLPGGTAGKSVVAYDERTGEPVWKVLDDVQAYTSPMLVTLVGKRQILMVSARRIAGLNVGDGSLIWEYPWVTGMDISVAQPVVIGENRVFLSASYGHGAAMIEIASGDKGLHAQQVWANGRMKNKFSTSVFYEGYLYGLDEAILACMDAATGELKWKGGRYGYGQVLLASGHLVLTTETGDVVLVKATPERHEELARFTAISGKTWNVPAISDGYLLVRNAQEMAGFRIGVELSSPAVAR